MNKEQLNQKLRTGNDPVLGIIIVVISIVVISIIVFIGVLPSLTVAAYIISTSILLGTIGIVIGLIVRLK